MAIPNNYIDKLTDKDNGESRLICPPAEHVRVENENFEADNLDEVLDELAEGIDDAGQVNEIIMNGEHYTPTNKVIDLGTVITQHQDISGKADKSTTYTKTETDNAIADAVEGLGGGSVESVSVNGGQPVPPVNGNVNLQGVATEDYVDDAVDDKLTNVVVNEMTGAADIITIDDADLAFIDEDGNIAMRVAEGHVETQHFDSRQVATNTANIQQLQSQIGQQSSVQTDVVVKEDADAAFDIADESGRVAFRITSKGHIKTKGFDSENMDVFRATKLDSPQCICHAIGAATGTENTIPYFRNGITKGYKFFEVDGYDCQDGVTICYHTLRQFKNKITGELETITPDNITSTDLLANYTWDDGTPIATLKEVIWFICYFHRYPLHVDVKSTMTSQSCYDAAEYAESLGVGKYVFFENGKYDLFGNLPQNRLMISTTSNIPSDAASYKKPDNNIIFIYGGSSTTDTDEQLAAFAKAAHDAGCYTEVYTYYNIEHVRRAFRCGIDFIITSGMTNNDV